MDIFNGKIKNVMSDSVGWAKGNVSDFYDFLLSNNIIQLGTAFVISTQVNKLASDFIDNIVSPIIRRVIGGNETKLKEKYIEIFGIKFETGNFLMSVLKFLIIMVVLYVVFKFTGIKSKK